MLRIRWSLLAAACASCATATSAGGPAMADPSNQNPSQPHPPGEPVQVNAGGGEAAAVIMTGIAVGASAAQRAAGGCYANCPPGTTCNPANGLCETDACHGRCSTDEFCDTSGPLPKCTARGHVDLHLQKEPKTGEKTPP